MAKDSWAYALHDAMDRSALAGRIAALKYDDDPRPCGLHPFLHLDQFGLQFAKFSLVIFLLEFAFLSDLRSIRMVRHFFLRELRNQAHANECSFQGLRWF